MNHNSRRVWFGILVSVCLITAVYVVVRVTPKQPVQVKSAYREVMGTFARIITVAHSQRQAQRCIEAGFDELVRIDALMSDYKADSELSKVNREAFAGPVKISPELFGILQKSVEFSRLSNGAFDITVGPLVDLWHRAGEANSLPDESALAEAKARVGYEKLLLDANELAVRFAVKGMRLDLGGIAKGYAIDKAVEAMKLSGAVAGMVDVGGDIRCFGKPLDRDAWAIGVQDPKAAGKDKDEAIEGLIPGDYLMVVRLSNAAAATSGDYRRFVKIEGKEFSHIIDTSTAEGAGKLTSVTVIAPTALEADALATAVSVLGVEKGIALVERLSTAEALLITASPQFELLKSSGADAYLH